MTDSGENDVLKKWYQPNSSREKMLMRVIKVVFSMLLFAGGWGTRSYIAGQESGALTNELKGIANNVIDLKLSDKDIRTEAKAVDDEIKADVKVLEVRVNLSEKEQAVASEHYKEILRVLSRIEHQLPYPRK